MHRPSGAERRATAARCVDAIAGVRRDAVSGGDGGGDEGGSGDACGVGAAVALPAPNARDRIFFRAAVERRSDDVAAEAVLDAEDRGDAGANSVCRIVAIAFWRQGRGLRLGCEASRGARGVQLVDGTVCCIVHPGVPASGLFILCCGCPTLVFSKMCQWPKAVVSRYYVSYSLHTCGNEAKSVHLRWSRAGPSQFSAYGPRRGHPGSGAEFAAVLTEFP